MPFGDDPALAARGITGTGSPATNTGLIVTESGLVFGAGRDNQIRAWDSDTGKQLWSSRVGGNFLGSPVMYQMSGTPYVLVAAASSAGFGGFGAGAAAAPAGGSPSAPAAPMGWTRADPFSARRQSIIESLWSIVVSCGALRRWG